MISFSKALPIKQLEGLPEKPKANALKTLELPMEERQTALKTGDIKLKDLLDAAYFRALKNGGRETIIFWKSYKENVEICKHFDRFDNSLKREVYIRINPLTGLFFTAKDTFPVVGMPCTSGGGGSPINSILPTKERKTVPIVQKALNSGAILLGKTRASKDAFEHHVLLNKYEYNGGDYSYQCPAEILFAIPHLKDAISNPFIRKALFGRKTKKHLTPKDNPELQIGGSSTGGALSVKQKISDFDIASSLSGSVGGPAAHTGIYGLLLPSGYGRGHIPSGQDEATAGILCNNLELLNTVAKNLLKETDLEHSSFKKILVGSFKVNANICIAQSIIDALNSLKLQEEAIDIDLNNLMKESAIKLGSGLGKHLGRLQATALYYAAFKPLMKGIDQKELGLFIENFLEGFKNREVKAAHKSLNQLKKLINEGNIILLPILPVTHSKVGKLFEMKKDGRGNNIPAYNLEYGCGAQVANALGCQAIYIPITKDKDGYPIVIQVLGSSYSAIKKVADMIEKQKISDREVPLYRKTLPTNRMKKLRPLHKL